MPKRFYLVDYTKNRKQILERKALEVAAKICVRYGSKAYTKDRISEFWDIDLDPLSPRQLERLTKAQVIKWVIYHELHYDDPVWNNDFIRGLRLGNKFSTKPKCYPKIKTAAKWASSLFEEAPFGGEVKLHWDKTISWQRVPALCLQGSEDSTSFIAGILCLGILVQRNGQTLVQYPINAKEFVDRMRIPIVEQNDKCIFISPMWPALFSHKMPKIAFEYFNSIKRGYLTLEYSVVLWKTYMDNFFPRRGIPFLPSRRSVFYKFNCEEGAAKRIEMMRFELGLAQLHNLVREAVKEWGAKIVKGK